LKLSIKKIKPKIEERNKNHKIIDIIFVVKTIPINPNIIINKRKSYKSLFEELSNSLLENLVAIKPKISISSMVRYVPFRFDPLKILKMYITHKNELRTKLEINNPKITCFLLTFFGIIYTTKAPKKRIYIRIKGIKTVIMSVILIPPFYAFFI
jgi:hypothetical protein